MALAFQFAWLVLAGASAAVAQNGADSLPAGDGRAVVMKACTGCHEVGTVIGSRRTKIGWQRNVDDMISRGATGSDKEMDMVVTYLTTYFGKINVNTASAKELETFLGLSEAEAQSIVGYRTDNGNIRDFEQLKKALGASAEKVQGKRGQIAFSL